MRIGSSLGRPGGFVRVGGGAKWQLAQPLKALLDETINIYEGVIGNTYRTAINAGDLRRFGFHQQGPVSMRFPWVLWLSQASVRELVIKALHDAERRKH